MENLIATNVEYIYKTKRHTVHALRGISAYFEPGKFYAIVGKSGCGKTTFLSLLAGLDVPMEGYITFNGKSTYDIDLDEYRMNHVALIYQNYNLLPLLTVVENVMYPLLLKGVKESEAYKVSAEKINSVGIGEDYFKRFPAMLSGGEQQRVTIARALASNPDIILADEPTGNLDTENGKRIISILRELATMNYICVIVVTHDPSIAEKADIIIKMADGKAVNEAC